MKISKVTPQITRVTTAPFLDETQKSAYSTKYLSNYWTDLYQIFNISRHMYVDYKTDFAMVTN